MTYEYGLNVWGGYFNDGVERPAEHREGTYFFEAEAERDAWKKELREAASASGQSVVTSPFEGERARERTVASFTLEVGRPGCFPVSYPMEYDFGYGYDAAEAHYMWEEGNYSCDCNRALFLERLYGEIPGLPDGCGDTILMRNFRVRSEAGPPGAFVAAETGPRLPPMNA
jgi:hypothetical protein